MERKNILRISTAAALVLMLTVSCSFFQMPSGDQKGSLTVTAQVKPQGGWGTSYTSAGTDRTLTMDSMALAMMANRLKLIFYPQPSGNTFEINLADGSFNKNSMDLSISSVPDIPTGTYHLTVEAYTLDGKVYLTGSTSTTFDVTVGTNTVSGLVLAPVMSASGTGSTFLKINYPMFAVPQILGAPQVFLKKLAWPSGGGTEPSTLTDISTLGSWSMVNNFGDGITMTGDLELEALNLSSGQYELRIKFQNFPIPFVETLHIYDNIHTGASWYFDSVSFGESPMPPVDPDMGPKAEKIPGDGSTTKNRVVLRWKDASTNEIGFVIYRRIGTDPRQLVFQTGPNVETWTDDNAGVGLAADTDYYYEIYSATFAGTSSTGLMPPVMRISSTAQLEMFLADRNQDLLMNNSVDMGFHYGQIPYLRPGIGGGAIIPILVKNSGMAPLTLSAIQFPASSPTPPQPLVGTVFTSSTWQVTDKLGNPIGGGTPSSFAVAPGDFAVISIMAFPNTGSHAIGDPFGASLSFSTDGGTTTTFVALNSGIVRDNLLHVDGTMGSDGNPGTPASPYQTLDKALLMAREGDEIKIASGTLSFGTPLVLKKDISISGGWDSVFSAQVGSTTMDNGGEGPTLVVEQGVVTMEKVDFPSSSSNPPAATIEIKKGATLNLTQSTVGTTYDPSASPPLAMAIRLQGGTLNLSGATLTADQPDASTTFNTFGLVMEEVDAVKAVFQGTNNAWTGGMNSSALISFVEIRGDGDFTSTGGTMVMSGTHNEASLIHTPTGVADGVRNITLTQMVLEQKANANSGGTSSLLRLDGISPSTLEMDRNYLSFANTSMTGSGKMMTVETCYDSIITNNLVSGSGSAGQGLTALRLTGSGAQPVRFFNNTVYLNGGWDFADLQATGLDLRNNIIRGAGGAGMVLNQNPFKVVRFLSNAVSGFTSLKTATPMTPTNVNLLDIVVSASTADVRANFAGDPGLDLGDTSPADGRPDLTPLPTAPHQVVFGGIELPEVPLDRQGNARTSNDNYSIGAFEQTRSYLYPYEPVGNWTFQGSMGTNYASGLHGYGSLWDLTLGGSPVPTYDPLDRWDFADVGNASIKIDIPSGYAETGLNAGATELSAGFTVSAWVGTKTPTADFSGTIVGVQETAGRYWSLDADYDHEGGGMNFSLRFSDDTRGVPDQIQQFTNAVLPHMPQGRRSHIHVAVVVNNATGSMDLYVDGVKKNIGPSGNPGVPINPAVARVKIGTGLQGTFLGRIDDVQIHDYPLTGTQVNDIFLDNSTAPNVTPTADLNFTASISPGVVPTGLGAPGLVTDRFGSGDSALYFNGGYNDDGTFASTINSGALEIPGTSLTDDGDVDSVAQGFSFGFWLKPLAAQNPEDVFTWGNGPAGLSMDYSLTANSLNLRHGGTLIGSVDNVYPDAWTHIFVTYNDFDPTAANPGQILVYQDGILRLNDNTVTVAPTAELLTFGKGANPGRYLLDDVVFYNRQLKGLEQDLARVPKGIGTAMYQFTPAIINGAPPLIFRHEFNGQIATSQVGPLAPYQSTPTTPFAPLVDRYSRANGAVVIAQGDPVKMNISTGNDDMVTNSVAGRTITFWAKLPGTLPPDNSTYNLLIYNDSTTGGHWGLNYVRDAGTGRVELWRDGSAVIYKYTNLYWGAGQWVHITITLGDPSGGNAPYGLAINGGSYSTLIAPVALPQIDNTPLVIGGGAMDLGLDDFRIYNRVLTLEEIRDVFLSGGTLP